MSIVRAARKNQYYTLPNSTIDDTRLSWEARGLLVYLLSKADNWNAQIKNLISQTKDCLGRASGRDKVHAILRELRAAGYLTRSYARSGGSFVGVDYVVSEVPDLEAGAAYQASLQRGTADDADTPPHTAKPDAVGNASPQTAKPYTVAPDTAKPDRLIKTERATKTEKAVKNLQDAPCGSPVDSDCSKLKGCPANYPGDPEAPNTLTWQAYALAFKARYRLWPIYNATVGGQLSKVIQRIGDESAMTARYYVEQVNQAQIVENCHPISALLRYCESYVVKARKAQTARLRAAENAKRVEAAASAPTTPIVALVANPLATAANSAAPITAVAQESRAKLASMLGGGLARRLKVETQSQEG